MVILFINQILTLVEAGNGQAFLHLYFFKRSLSFDYAARELRLLADDDLHGSFLVTRYEQPHDVRTEIVDVVQHCIIERFLIINRYRYVVLQVVVIELLWQLNAPSELPCLIV